MDGAVHRTDSLGASYPMLLDRLRSASVVESRSGRTREILDFTLVLSEPARCIVDRDSFSRRFMDAEIAMLLGGVYDGSLLRAITPKAADLTTPLTAYGPRVRSQLVNVIQELRGDLFSRRAVVYVGDRDDLESVGESTAGEMPCTMTWQFLLRERPSDQPTAEHPGYELHMIANMRSWDAVWGLSYDVPCFVAVQLAVAKALGVEVGTYHHHAGSFHLYERHWNVEARPSDAELEVEWATSEWETTVQAARTVIEVIRAGALQAKMQEALG